MSDSFYVDIHDDKVDDLSNRFDQIEERNSLFFTKLIQELDPGDTAVGGRANTLRMLRDAVLSAMESANVVLETNNRS